MIRTDNVLFLKKYFPDTWEKLNNLDVGNGLLNIQVVPTKNGLHTLKIDQDSASLYLHSQYDPFNEADRFIRKFNDLDSYEHIFFYGVGLGYHVKALLKYHPHASFTLYEPRPEIMYYWLAHDQLETYPWQRMKNIFVETSDSDRQHFLGNMANQLNEKILLVVWPAYERLFKEQYQQFLEDFREKIKDKRTAWHVNVAFEKRWTMNCIYNLKYTLTTPNILHDVDKGYFRKKPAILVAAGPSLQYEFDKLRKIKEEGRAYIFSVGSAINALIEQGIFPDAACTYDPSEKNYIVFKKLKERQISNIPLVFGTSVGYETLDNYPGKMFHMIISQDTVTPYIIGKDLVNKMTILQDAPSIAVVTLAVLAQLGCNPIILVGQDFAYPNKQRYAQGIEYEHVSSRLSEEDEKSRDMQWVDDVEGKPVLSSQGLIQMKKQMEQLIMTISDVVIINTSRLGAKIEGAPFKPLDQVLGEELKETGLVNHAWTEAKPAYKYDDILEQYRTLDRERHTYRQLVSEINDCLHQIKSDVTKQKMYRLERLYKRLEKGLKRLLRNDFYTVILNPILRTKAEILNMKVAEVNFEQDVFKKAAIIHESFSQYMKALEESYEIFLPVYEKMRSDLEQILIEKGVLSKDVSP